VGDVPWIFTHEAKVGEVALLALDLLILFWARGVVTGEVKAIQGSTRSGHDLLKHLLLVVSEVVLLLVVALVARVILVGVVILVGGVELLSHGAVGDEVGGVATPEAAPGWSPLLLAEFVQGTKLPHQQGDLIIKMLAYCSSEAAVKEDKVNSKANETVLVGLIITTNTSTSNQNFTRERSIIIRMTFTRQFMRFMFVK
jgi:hypothetical protein